MLSKKTKPFLTANWLRLVSINYLIDPLVLEKHLPAGTVSEDFQGNHYVSLVAFKYENTKLHNVHVPFYRNFEELNLRFYVKRKIASGKWRSEVAFTKLFFPKRALTLVANKIYKENYETLKMNHFWSEDSRSLFTDYRIKKNEWHYLHINSSKNSSEVEPNSIANFISKQYWGTAKINENSCTSYEIEHPEWKIHEVLNYKLSIDFGLLFGEEFQQLSKSNPASVHLFDGSAVTVKKRKIIYTLNELN